MLRSSFCHIPGIGLKTEKKLWEAGITSWDKWSDDLPLKIPAASRADAFAILEESRRAVNDDPKFFTSRLPGSESWRIFSDFRDRTAYLDIETNGLAEGAEVTTIALYDGRTVRTYVNGINLDSFLDDIWNYSVLVSYNGKSFDIPFLENYFRVKLEHAQIDLRYVLARLGLKGGLKNCEKQLGLNRGHLDGVDGYFAVLLWNRYHYYNDPRALETLLAYNIEDTVNLERLAVEAFNRNLALTPLGESACLECPPPPPNPCTPHQGCIEDIRSRLVNSSTLS
jgi:uncharacterized protein YprB with RNaseH-like and TPR domain